MHRNTHLSFWLFPSSKKIPNLTVFFHEHFRCIFVFWGRSFEFFLVVRFHWKISTQVQGESTVEPFIERDCDIAEFLKIQRLVFKSAGDGGNCGFGAELCCSWMSSYIYIHPWSLLVFHLWDNFAWDCWLIFLKQVHHKIHHGESVGFFFQSSKKTIQVLQGPTVILHNGSWVHLDMTDPMILNVIPL